MSTDNSEDMLPCPFCSSEFPPVASKDKQGHVIICTGCSALGPTRGSPAEAITAWNTRPSSPTSGDAVERQAVLDALHTQLPYPTEACSIVRSVPTLSASPQSTEGLREAASERAPLTCADGQHSDDIISTAPLYQCKHCGRFSE